MFVGTAGGDAEPGDRHGHTHSSAAPDVDSSPGTHLDLHPDLQPGARAGRGRPG
ncbi:hypothetical protein [Terrabacter sp. Ter38]|uniref:hypothetical protein n=1 Tax=Terrabacter sp. Ter38 TaxID=2926030 RepID=UPI002117BC52|nr:hypothetical protein [Terrabacter sp. Ter38]